MDNQQTNQMTDAAIATELLLGAKAGILSYAAAITETASTDLKKTLQAQLNSAIQSHEQISKYMIEKGYYHPHDVKKQLQQDIQATQAVLSLAQNQSQNQSQSEKQTQTLTQ